MTYKLPPARVEQFRTRDGLMLSADVWEPVSADAGPCVLMLHGGGQTRKSWKRTGARLALESHLVIALDTRGHGDSAWSATGDYGLDTLADDVLDVVADVGQPMIVVGASMGGMTALIASERTDHANFVGLVLVDIVPQYEEAGSRRVREFMLGGLGGYESLDEVSAAVIDYLPQRSRPASTEGLKRNLRFRDGRWYWHWDPAFMSRPTETRTERVARLERAASELTIPLLVVWGEQSDVVTKRGVAALQRLAPQVQVVQLPGAGHTAAGDDNDAFSAAVAHFVRPIGSCAVAPAG